MALIGSIRKNGWILIVAMALALGGFILMDVMSNSQRYSAADVNTLGKVAGTEIKRSEFESYQKLVYSDPKGNPFQVRTQAWTYFTEKAVIEKETEALGLGVCKDELLELQFGVNISPVITERFQNPDGQPNRTLLASIKNAIDQGQFSDPKNRAYWAVQEKEVVKARLQEKYSAAISKGMYTPSWQAEMVFHENNERRDFRMVRITWDKVKEDEAPVTDADYEKFLEENPHLYDQHEESRVVAYVAYDVVPTSGDTAAVREVSAKLLEGFRTTKNDSTFVLGNEGFISNQYIPKDNFPAAVRDSVMKVSFGTVLGPVLDDGEWRLIKVLDRKALPDSVRARHILLRDATPENKSKADSLVNLINSGKASFDSVAIKVSQDGGSGQKGGDLGWFANGAMVPEFNEVCFVTGEQGKMYTVATQFGWHIIQITGKKFLKNEISVKAAIINRKVEPSKSTQQLAKDKAVALIQQAKTIADLETLAGQQNIPFLSTPPLKINDYSAGALGVEEDAREIIRWAFNEDVKVGAVGKEVFAFGDPQGGYFDKKYVVAALKSVLPKGKASVAVLKALPEADQKVKNRKKAEVIISKLQNAEDLGALAAQWTAGKIDTVRNGSIMQTGGEPRVAGIVFSMETGKVSKPIAGNGAVFIVQPLTDKTQQQMPSDLTMFRRQVSSQSATSIRTSLMKSLIREYELKDYRNRFY